jgi:hypothetical protein
MRRAAPESMTEYTYDVFISYVRGGHVDKWVEQWFHQHLHEGLQNELDDDPTIFWDKRSLNPGDNWRVGLQNGLAASKCLVPIWTPPYFRSSWCNAEWRCFLERERETGSRLIHPVQWHDSSRFPPEARETQLFDFREFAVVGSAFSQTQTFIEFERRMKVFCTGLADKIRRVPPRNQSWKPNVPELDRSQRTENIARPVLAAG